MPRAIDRDEREREITSAAMEILATEGPGALTLRGLATRLGGSNTLVTHFYPNRAELLKGILNRLLLDFDEELDALELGASPEMRLKILLQWLLPLDEEALTSERGRILLLGGRSSGLPVQEFIDSMEERMVSLLRQHVEPLVTPDEVDLYAGTLRTITNGIVLSTVEHPDRWPAQRQLQTLELLLRGIGFDAVVEATPPEETA